MYRFRLYRKCVYSASVSLLDMGRHGMGIFPSDEGLELQKISICIFCYIVFRIAA